MAETHPVPRKTIVAGFIGNVLEWYDFAVYAFLAPIIGQQFFPSDDPVASILAAFGVFASGYLMRPIGGAVFGHIGDKIGRKTVLTLSVMLMGVSTFSIGILPTYAQIGYAAPVLLVILRLAQGFSVGGEFTGSAIYLIELAPANRRGMMSGFCNFGVILGFLIGSSIGALISTVLTAEELSTWGWRVPFLLGIAIGLVALYIRRHAIDADAPIEEGVEEKGKSPAIEAIQTQWRLMLKIAGIILTANVGFYLMFVYITTYLNQHAKVSMSLALGINTFSMAVLMLLVPLGGLLSDKIGRKPTLLIAAAGILVLSYPLMELVHHVNVAYIVIGQLGLGVLIAIGLGTNAATLVEMVPQRLRCSTISIGYNVTLAIFGGTTPLVASYLIERTHDDLSPAFYLMAMAAVTLGTVLTLKETAGKPLP